MKIYFLLNPSHAKNLWSYREMAAQAARRTGSTARFGQVDRNRPQSTDQLLGQACEEGCERIVVVGGDGSLHRAVNTLRRLDQLSRREIALVPAGTCNDLARAMGLSPRFQEKAFALACSGEPRSIDLGEMTVGSGEPVLFVNNAGFGRRVDTSGRRMRPLRSLRTFRPNVLKATWERGALEGSFYLGIACNGPFFSAGLHFSRSVLINDGWLDVYLFPVMPKWRMLPMLLAGRLGRPVRSRRMIALRVQQLRVDSESDLWPQADGEPPSRSTRRVTYEVASERAQIIAPPTARTALWTI